MIEQLRTIKFIIIIKNGSIYRATTYYFYKKFLKSDESLRFAFRSNRLAF